MRILIIDQCSSSKDYPDGVSVLGADSLDNHSLEELQARNDVPNIEARELYAGRQQRKIAEGIRMLERDGHEVDRYFISAGFGLVEDSQRLPPYNLTFSDMSDGEIDARADKLGIPDNVGDLLEAEPPYDVVYFALGNDYYRSLNLETTLKRLPAESTGIVFNSEEAAEQVSNVVSISARNEEAKEFGTIVVALKGIYLKNLAKELTDENEVPDADQLVRYCLSQEPSQVEFEEFE